MMKKIEFVLKYCSFTIDYSNKFVCTDKNILGHYQSSTTLGDTKEQAAQAMVKLYDDTLNLTDDAYTKKTYWALGWSSVDDSVEINPVRLKEICLSIIAEDAIWLKQQENLAPIGREYLLKEFLTSHFWLDYYRRQNPSAQVKEDSVNYAELLKEIRTFNSDESFEFSSYNKDDCIREGFFIVYSQKSLDELKALIKVLSRT